jgi:hypothetical protein
MGNDGGQLFVYRHLAIICINGRMNYKDTEPYMSAFFKIDLLTEFAALCLTDFIDWRYIHSLVGIFDRRRGGGGGGGVELCSRPYSAGILHSVSDQIQNLPNCVTTPNKITSEDDIKGLVSLSSFVHASINEQMESGGFTQEKPNS